MSQQINLYDAAFRTQKKSFSATTMAATLGGVILVFVLLHVYLVSQLRGMERALEDTDKALANLRGQIVLLAARNASQGGGPALVEEIARAETRLRARQDLLQDITTRVAADAQGYSGLLRGLARRATPGLWLTGLSVRETRDLEIRGRALDAKLVPAYLQSLSAETFAQGRTVTELMLKAGESARGPQEASSGAARPAATLRYVEFAVTFTPKGAMGTEAGK